MDEIHYELLAAARAGDRTRFDAVFDAWVTVVYGAALRHAEGRRDRAEALTSATMTAWLLRALGGREEAPVRESTNGLRKAAALQ